MKGNMKFDKWQITTFFLIWLNSSTSVQIQNLLICVAAWNFSHPNSFPCPETCRVCTAGCVVWGSTTSLEGTAKKESSASTRLVCPISCPRTQANTTNISSTAQVSVALTGYPYVSLSWLKSETVWSTLVYIPWYVSKPYFVEDSVYTCTHTHTLLYVCMCICVCMYLYTHPYTHIQG